MVDRGEVEIHHCPTKEMWSDILTKPKQGKDFVEMRAKLLGHDHGAGYAKTRPDSKIRSATRQNNSARSPRGCVGPELYVRERKTGYERDLHMVNNGRRRTLGLAEPSRTMLAGTRKTVRAAAE